jgi:hypothetical protein
MFEAGRTKGVLMNKSRQLRPVIVGVLVALVWMIGKASAAQCGSTRLASRRGKGNSLVKRRREALAPPPSQHSWRPTIRLRLSWLTVVREALVCRFNQFLAKRGGSTIVARGRALKQSNAALLASIQQRFGVPPGPLLAIWGMETGFGSSRGNQNVLSAVATLAYDCRRTAYFTDQLYAAHITPWAACKGLVVAQSAPSDRVAFSTSMVLTK